jgi:CubicO group peptidase (beta-lactamase class C family)
MAGPGRRITPDMVFDMGSMTKQFTAAGILLLEEDGRLTTRDSLGRFFSNVPADKRGITIHQMLTHTSGLISDFAGDYDQIARDSAVRAVLNAPLRAPPGTAFNYSNAAFSLLAMVIEQLSGLSYDDFLKQRILEPIGMRHTGYVVRDLDSTLVARTYTPPVDHGTPAQRLHRAGGPGWNLRGNGGLLTTVADLYRYERALARGSPISFAIQEKQFGVQFRRSAALGHGYDWWIESAGEDGIQLNRAGDGPPTGVSAEYRRYPKDSSVFILLANNRHRGGSTRRYVMPNLRRLYRGRDTLEPPLVTGAAEHELNELAGIYQIDSSSWFVVDRVGDHLALSAFGQPTVDVMIFNRDSTSVLNRRRINERALALVASVRSADTAAMRSALGGSDIQAAARWWNSMLARHGPWTCSEVLGTDRMDRGVFLSTVRLRFRDRPVTVRWAWSGATPVVNSEDWYLPGVFSFGAESPTDAGAWSPYWWRSAPDSVVTYDLAANTVLRAHLIRDASGRVSQLVFEVPQSPARATRVAAAPRLPCN